MDDSYYYYSQRMKLFLITGASKGFGRCIVQSLVQRFPSSSSSSSAEDETNHFALFGRDRDGLEQVQTWIRTQSPKHRVTLHLVDMSLVGRALEEALSQEWPSLCTDAYQESWIFNNAGSLGTLARIPDWTLDGIQQAVQVNVVAPFYLTSQLLTRIRTNRFRVVHVSSLCALEPFDTMGIYCAGKAARDMFHRCLAIEKLDEYEKAERTVRVLNYAPGPMDTQMQQEIREQMPAIPLRQTFQEMHRDRKLVIPQDSSDALLELLLLDEYSNGAHLDYYDYSEIVKQSVPPVSTEHT